MTIKKTSDLDPQSTTEIWLDAYISGGYHDIETFESFSLHFLSKVNDHLIKEDELIADLCINTFSAIAVSSFIKINTDGSKHGFENVPVLSLFLHPFKEIRSSAFGKDETLFSVLINPSKPQAGVKTIEFGNALELFKPWTKGNTTTTPSVVVDKNDSPAKTITKKDKNEEDWIITPSFRDFFDENFLNTIKNDDGYKPLNNATEIAPVRDLTSTNANKDDPLPLYRPRKTIALTPTMVRVIFEMKVDNFDGIFDGIREYAWYKVKTFRKRDSCMAYLHYIFHTLQAFWAHGQCSTSMDNSTSLPENFAYLHCDPLTLVKETKSRWALEKTASITDSMAVFYGHFTTKAPSQANDDDTQQVTGSGV
jgi:hypothetical protein